MNISTLGNHAYRLFWELPPGPDGKRRRETRTVHGTWQEAQAAWAKRQGEIDAGQATEPSRMTLAELADRWIDAAKAGDLDVSTLEWYQTLLRVHIKPDLGAMPLRKITPAQLQAYYKTKLSSGGRRDGKPGGLSRRTVHALHGLIHSLLKTAYRWEMVPRNVADLVTPPSERAHEARFWDSEQAARFLEAAEANRLWALWALAILTGLRQGELLALRWRDVELEGKALRVRHATKRTKDKARRVGLPKSEQSRRTISLDDMAVSVLRTHKARQNEERLALGSEYEQNGLVFCTHLGRPLMHRNVLRLHHQLCEKAGVPDIGFHEATRHTHATLLYAAGADDKTVQNRLGHESASFTKQVYIHAIKARQIAAAEEVGRQVLGKKKPSAK